MTAAIHEEFKNILNRRKAGKPVRNILNRKRAYDSNAQMKANDIARLAQQIKELEKVVTMLVQQRQKQNAKPKTFADQEYSHTVPAESVDGIITELQQMSNDASYRLPLVYDNPSYELGMEWARKYNPHYKPKENNQH